MKHFLLTAVTLSGLSLCGCRNNATSSDGEYAKELQSRTAAMHRVDPQVREYPVNPSLALGKRTPVVQQPEAIWKPTKLTKVNMSGYVDEHGNLHQPESVYVVCDMGGWNVDAVNSGQHYVPAPNSVSPVNLPGVAYSTGSAVPKAPTNDSITSIVDPSAVRVTGIVDAKERVAASAFAGKGEVAIFDKSLGWVIVPQAQLSGVSELKTELTPTPKPVEENVTMTGQVRGSTKQVSKGVDDTRPKPKGGSIDTPTPNNKKQEGVTVKEGAFNDL